MARRVRTYVEVTDDLDGKLVPEGEAQNLTFVWRGGEFEIDVSDEHADALDELMRPIVQAARRTGGRKLPLGKKTNAIENNRLAIEPPSRTAQEMAEREMRNEVRAWARENGWPTLSSAGRISKEIRDAWNTAHPDRPVPDEASSGV